MISISDLLRSNPYAVFKDGALVIAVPSGNTITIADAERWLEARELAEIINDYPRVLRKLSGG